MDFAIIKEIRLSKGIKLIDLQRDSGINRDTISRIERGRADPKISTVTAILNALDAKITVLENKHKYLKVIES